MAGSPYVDGGRQDNTKYWYRVTPFNYGHIGAVSGQATGTTEYSPVTAPPTWWTDYPKDDISDAVSTLIRMNSMVPEALDYKVYWKKNAALTGDPPTNADGTFDPWPAGGGDPTTEYDHAGGFVDGDIIYYAVCGYNPDSQGPCVTGNTTVVGLAPNAPEDVAASQVGSVLQVTWTDMSDNEDNFRLEYKERECGGAFGSWFFEDEPAAEDESYDFTPSDGYEYVFQVRAENAVGESAYDTMGDGEAVQYSSSPDAPTGLTVVKDSGDPDDDMDIDWTDPVAGLFHNIALYRHPSTFTPPGTGTLLSNTIEPAVEHYDDNGLGTAAGTATIDSVDPIASDTLQVDISAHPDALEYALYRDLSSGFTPGPGNLVEDGLDFVDFPYDDDDGGGGLSPETEYFYKLIVTFEGPTFFYRAIALNDCGKSSSPSNEDSDTLDDVLSAPSSAVSGTTWPNAPLDFDCVLDDSNCPTSERADLTWDNGGNTSSTFRLEWSDISADPGDMTLLESAIGAGVEYYNHLTPSTGDNWYRIKFNTGGDGSWATKMKGLNCPA
jgi:hypothetical protein